MDSCRLAAARLVLATVTICCISAATPTASQPVGSEFPVNTTTAGDQTLPDVAINAAGYFVVVWESAGQDGSELGVFGQRFDPAGVKLGPEFQINTYTDNNQAKPAVALRDDGSFVVVWESRGQDGDGNGIFARLFDAAGTPAAPEFQINTYTFSNESAPDVSVDADGNFAVAWQSTQQDGSSDAAMVRRYDAGGVALTPEIIVNSHTYGFQGAPHIGCEADGDFVTAYASWELDGDGYAVGVRRVTRTGGLVGDEMLINQYSVSHQDYPDIAVVPDGRFIVVWHSALQDGNGYGVYARRYNADGSRTGPEFQINSYTLSSQMSAKVAADRFGGFTVLWQSFGQDGSRNGVYGHRYQWDGTPEGSLFRGNTTRTDDQERPSVASTPDGDLVVVWQSRNQDGGGYGVYARRVASVPVGVTATVLPAHGLSLSNHPNPFNPATTIRYAIPAPARVTLKVYAADGSHVLTLFEGALPAGRHTATWDGTDPAGHRVSSGVYLCRLTANKQLVTRKMLLLK